MPFEAKDYKPSDRIYSYVSDDGRSVNIDAVKLRAWCHMELKHGNLEVFLVPVDHDLAQQWVKDGTVLLEHVLDLTAYPTLDPVIFGQWPKPGPDSILIDGHHRYALMGLCNMPQIPAFVLTETQWRAFEITGLPELPKDALAEWPAAPNTWRPR
jgi:hypothetical protein